MFKCAFVVLAAVALAAAQQNLDCMSKDNGFLPCLAVKAISAIDRASRSAKFDIIDGITVVRTAPLERSARTMKSEAQVLESLPEGTVDKTLALANRAIASVINFVQTHTVEVDPKKARSFDEVASQVNSEMNNSDNNSMNEAFTLILTQSIHKMAPLMSWALGGVLLKAIVIAKIFFVAGAYLLFKTVLIPLWALISQKFNTVATSGFGQQNFYSAQPASWAQTNVNAYLQNDEAAKLAYSVPQQPAVSQGY